MTKLFDTLTRLCAGLLLILIVGGMLWWMVKHPPIQIGYKLTNYFDAFSGDTATVEVSYYSKEHGDFTASGEIFDSTLLSCASMDKILFGTMVIFKNGEYQCVAVVNDRMPSKYKKTNPTRKYDVSKAVAESLRIVTCGIKTILTKVVK